MNKQNNKFDSCGFPIRTKREQIVTWAVAIIGTALWFSICVLMLKAGSKSL